MYARAGRTYVSTACAMPPAEPHRSAPARGSNPLAGATAGVAFDGASKEGARADRPGFVRLGSASSVGRVSEP